MRMGEGNDRSTLSPQASTDSDGRPHVTVFVLFFGVSEIGLAITVDFGVYLDIQITHYMQWKSLVTLYYSCFFLKN